MTETTQRVLVAAVGIPLAIGVVFVGGWALAALVAVIAILAALEFYRLSELKGAEPMPILGAVLAAAFVALAALRIEAGPPAFGALVIVATLAVATVAIWARGIEGQPILSISTTLTGAVYTGGLLTFGLFLRHLPDHDGALHGTAIVCAPLLLTWTSDTFAYFVGRRFGKHKLIPRVSPGKTVEGAVGAVVGSVLVGIGYSMLLASFASYRTTPLEGALLGLLVSVVAQVGDLAESLFKRDAGVKDSGTLLPGHGGALDRFDSLLFTLPIAYYFFRYWVGPIAVGG